MNQGAASAAGAWRALRTDDGSWTLLHPIHGQACHDTAGAWTQARERYASLIAQLEDEQLDAGRLRLLDIGTGMGLNLAAALEACEARGLSLDAVSFEIDPRVVRAAAALESASLEHARILRTLESMLDARQRPATAMIDGGRAHRLSWWVGDARESLPQLESGQRFDAVFLDPFSPAADPPLWEEAFLLEVARRMALGARLASYTVSLRVRAALARAGLNVGAGPRVGRKAAGTLASRGGSVPALDPRTRRRLERARAGGV